MGKDNYQNLADLVLKTIDTLQKHPEVRKGIPAGMKGLVGELLTLSKLHSLKEIDPKKIEYKGGRSRYDIIVAGKKILVKTKFYGDEKKYGVEDGFLWSDVRVDEKRDNAQVEPKLKISFDFMVLVGIRNGKTEFYVLDEEEFRKYSSDSPELAWGWKRGGRVIGIVRKKAKDVSSAHAEEFSKKEILNLFDDSKDEKGWQKIVNGVSDRNT